MSKSLLRRDGIYSISFLATQTVGYSWAYKYKKQSYLLNNFKTKLQFELFNCVLQLAKI